MAGFRDIARITGVVLVAALAYTVFGTLNTGGAFRTLVFEGDEECKLLSGDDDFVGLEDIVVVREGPHKGVAVTAGDHRHSWMVISSAVPPLFREPVNATQGIVDTEHPIGGMYFVDMNKDAPSTRRVEVVNFPRRDFHPHGLDLLQTDDGRILLFVINHVREGDTIDVFELDIPAGQATYLHGKANSLFRQINNLHAVSETEVYVTNWIYYSVGSAMNWVELYTRRSWGTVVHCTAFNTDEPQCTVALSGMYMPNGITGPKDGSFVYIASAANVLVYSRDASSGTLALVNTVTVDTAACDNLDLHPSGDLTTGAHPNVFMFVAHSTGKSDTAPSQVVRIPRGALHPEEGVPPPASQYLMMHDGALLSASATAVAVGDRYLVGGVYGPGLLMCPLPAGRGSGTAIAGDAEL